MDKFTKIAINPGTGPVVGSSEQNAIENMKHFMADACPDAKFVRVIDEDEDGRYGFLVYKGNRCHEILMPGLPLENVRYMGNEGQNIWNFPRLYVDGSSWVWAFALGRVFDEEEEE